VPLKSSHHDRSQSGTLHAGFAIVQSSEPLPAFRYHPDPLATGSVRPDSDTACLGCNRIRGYIYTGPVYTEKNFILDEHLCPWCIADGSAAKQFGATFNDTAEATGIPDQVRGEIETRTPGFNAWQQEEWQACCGDVAAFLGPAGTIELQRDFPAAIPVIKTYLRSEYDLSRKDAEEFFAGLSKDGPPTAYIFRCLHCNQYLSYVDQT
jgi:uncharacterized protein